MDSTAHATDFDPFVSSWRAYELNEGETVAGIVRRLPRAGDFNGSRLFLATDGGEVLAMRATAKAGHTVLANLLERHKVKVGDRITITFAGWGQATKTGFNMRMYELRTCTEAPPRGGGER